MASIENSNKYPFVTKAQIASRLENEPDFRMECLLVLYRRQTEDEQERKETKYKNKRGFMSSHAVNGTRLAEQVLAGEEITEEDQGKIDGMVVRYTKQLASHFRAIQADENPELVEQAKVFGL